VSGATVDPGITLSCPAGGQACSVDETATVTVGAPYTPILSSRTRARHAMTVGSGSLTIPPGATVQATFTLDALGQALLADHKQLPVGVSVSGAALGQSTVSATKAIVLKGRHASYSISSIRMRPDGTVSVRVRASDAGLVEVMLSAAKDNIATAARVLTPAPARFVYARASKTTAHASVLSFLIRPNAQGRSLLLGRQAGAITLRLWVSYVPLYSFQIDTGYYGLHPGASCHACHVRVWP